MAAGVGTFFTGAGPPYLINPVTKADRQDGLESESPAARGAPFPSHTRMAGLGGGWQHLAHSFLSPVLRPHAGCGPQRPSSQEEAV